MKDTPKRAVTTEVLKETRPPAWVLETLEVNAKDRLVLVGDTVMLVGVLEDVDW